MANYPENIIDWQGDHLLLLDQRLLPNQEQYVACHNEEEVGEAIKNMTVRGAPAIGITAAYGVVLAAMRLQSTEDAVSWRNAFEQALEKLATARPTAVNLKWALQRMRQVAFRSQKPVQELLSQAKYIHEQEKLNNKKMAELALELIEPSSGVLTHCNTGALATGGYGTALEVIRHAYHQGKITKVFADETRPWLQGARLTAWELLQNNIPVTLIADAAAAHLFRSGQVQWLIVGADRIMANGDVANKIGTYHAAIAARYHNVKVMVVAPSSTIDLETSSGERVEIEQRSASEVLCFNSRPVAPEGSDAWNPVFDVTPSELIDAIVTELGVVKRPDQHKLVAMMTAT